MSGNRSLDEFADDPSEAEPPASAATSRDRSTAAEPTGEAADTTESGSDDPETVPDRPASTYAWHPEPAPCGACGEPVTERWRAGDDWVCGDCKEW